ncbi:MAG: hypothetical protein HY077_17600 [Elusimicrobia bacterium]|nr:hypothetical protein [Elusimicrobiota bacterium]
MKPTGDMEADLKEALSLAEQGDFDGAVAMAEPYQGRHFLADYHVATAVFRKAGPKNLSREDTDRVLARYDACLGQNPGFPDALMMRGLCLIKKISFAGSLDEKKAVAERARRDFEECRRLDPGFARDCAQWLEVLAGVAASLGRS